MTALTTNERAFIEKMKESEELARHGFALLLKRPDFVRFFQPLRDAGLFAPERNPAPEPAREEGYVRIPYWSALDYLVAISTQAGTTNDIPLANEVMDIVRAVSQWRDPDAQPRQNYHTARRFTELFGHLPTSAVSKTDLGLLATWLNDRFERMLVAVAIDETLLPHLLASTSEEDWDKAVTVLQHATAITSIEELGTKDRTARTIIDDYWLQQLLLHHVQTLASKRPEGVVQVLEGRVRDVYATDLHKGYSSVYRPAIENHDQNHRFRSAENRTVEAFRDAVLTWAANEPTNAKRYVETLLVSNLEILRRVAINVMNLHWPTMHSLYLPFVQRDPFTVGHLHELHALLAQRFAEFTGAERKATIDALWRIPAPTHAEDPEVARKHLQQRWLTAIIGKGAGDADDWMAALSTDPTVGPPALHPEFTTYISSWTGPGASPYTIEELVGFADAYLLVERLNNFKDTGTWGSPTLEGLTSKLQGAARTNPAAFVRALLDFVDAKSTFLHAIITGLQQAWEAKQQSLSCNWDEAWAQLIRFFEQLVAGPPPAEDENNQHKWLLAAIVDCLRAGTQDDEHAYTPTLLPRGQAIIDTILHHLPAETTLPRDPMFAAINTPKGRAIEALFSHALRACRVADQTTGSHTAAWAELQAIFGRELNACQNNNVEFSTLCGAYLAQLEFLDAKWTTEHIPYIFPEAFPINDQAAVAGLAYAAFTRHIYDLLIRGRIIDRALHYDLKGREAREKLLERIAAAYVWGIETLDSPRFQTIFGRHDVKDLEQVTWVLWTLRHQSITEDQQERVLAFWERCVNWSHTETVVCASLLSALSALATYIAAVDERGRSLLLAVAPHVGIGHHTYEFVDELLRLAVQNPSAITEVLESMIAAHAPEYDYEGRLYKLLQTLAANGKKNEVLRMLDRVLHLPGMHDLFNELTSSNTPKQ
ncbi:MAG: hypothetical protein DMG97_14400 [Acidobacteria bacterium]|nr:MAG: hypothetical protein DMG97_14400 [Acidobacteriota bacterium]